jgi:hypothetical protein
MHKTTKLVKDPMTEEKKEKKVKRVFTGGRWRYQSLWERFLAGRGFQEN